jgi:hypothetical protein
MKLLFFVLSLTLLLSGCGSSSSGSDKKTQSLSLNNVKTNSTVTLKLNDTDSIKSYSWWSQDGGILGHTSSVRWTAPSKSGRYTVTVDTVDRSNEKSTSSIVINVVDDLSTVNKPTITLNGRSSLAIVEGSNYIELGASANDNQDGDITGDIVVEGDVDTSTIGTYIITYSIVDSDGNKAEVKRTVRVKEDVYEDPKSFAKIKRIIASSKTGTRATYICVGDSTRAKNTNTNAQRLFDSVKYDLSLYNVNSILRARGSHMLEEFINNTNTPRVSEVISDIPGRGETSIVDMSLGVNDFFYLNEHLSGTYAQKKVEIRSTVKARLKQALNLILKAKPKTTIYLTTPNPMYSWKDATDIMKSIYIEVSNEMSLPLVNYVDPLMNGFEENRYDNWYRMLDTGKLDGIHFSDYGLDQVSRYILGKILP